MHIIWWWCPIAAKNHNYQFLIAVSTTILNTPCPNIEFDIQKVAIYPQDRTQFVEIEKTPLSLYYGSYTTNLQSLTSHRPLLAWVTGEL